MVTHASGFPGCLREGCFPPRVITHVSSRRKQTKVSAARMPFKDKCLRGATRHNYRDKCRAGWAWSRNAHGVLHGAAPLLASPLPRVGEPRASHAHSHSSLSPLHCSKTLTLKLNSFWTTPELHNLGFSLSRGRQQWQCHGAVPTASGHLPSQSRAWCTPGVLALVPCTQVAKGRSRTSGWEALQKIITSLVPWVETFVSTVEHVGRGLRKGSIGV